MGAWLPSGVERIEAEIGGKRRTGGSYQSHQEGGQILREGTHNQRFAGELPRKCQDGDNCTAIKNKDGLRAVSD